MDPRIPGQSSALKRLLIIEDDVSLGRLIQLALRSFSIEGTVVRTGAEGLRLLHAEHFDAMACDISLPDMSGLDVIATARADEPAIGIVAITGFVDVDVAVRSMKAGADDFLGKPFDARILWHVLSRATDSRTLRREAEQANSYRELAYTDALTGCHNRRFLDEFIIDAVEKARASETPLSVAFIDIDNFKLLNDFLGYEQGDLILVRVAQALAESIVEPAVFARFGGDEFVAVFPGSTPATARGMLEKAREVIAGITVINGHQITIPTRISCGVSVLSGPATPRDLIAEAEDQMYLDKAVPTAILQPGLEAAFAPDSLIKVSNLKALRNLVKAIDRRDSYTRYHSDHATQAASRLGRALNIEEDYLTAIAIAGPIHDLGKIVVPDEVLRKPGPLTAAERRTMEEHPVMGAAITAAVTDYDTVVNLVRHHHERFDGKGYPAGLQREEISLPTRIFTLADAYSAMTTDRPYRMGLSLEQAIEQIAKGAGTQFDPDLAAVFIKVLGEDLLARITKAA